MPRMDMLTETAADIQRNEFADTIPLADTAGHWNRQGRRPAKRNRQWEKAHRPYRYVNVPLELREQVLALAEFLSVTADEVARALFEYGMGCVEDDKLRLHTHPNPHGRRMTLFPRDQARGWQEANDDPRHIPARKRKRSESSRKFHPAVSYRIPKELHNRLCGLAVDLDASVGEVVTFLLRYGLEAYRSGKLSLQPHPVTVKMTLSGEQS